MNEVEILKSIDHPHVVKVFEFFEDEQRIYIVMEFLDGGELFDKIQENDYFTESNAKQIMKDLLETINYLHNQNIVHRDLKPENILFNKEGVLKIADFGTSKVFEKQMHAVRGTVYYIAPEVLTENYDYKCDIWSLGVIFYILLCGYPPFFGKNDEEIIESIKIGKFDFNLPSFQYVSSDAKDLIQKMLQKSPQKRCSAQQALQHPWFKNKTLDNKVSSEHMKNLINFSAQNKLQQALYFYLINQTTS